MLLQIRDVMMREKTASNQQLARLLGIDMSALEPMLSFWVARGVIVCRDPVSACKDSCGGCAKKAPVYYEYIGLYYSLCKHRHLHKLNLLNSEDYFPLSFSGTRNHPCAL